LNPVIKRQGNPKGTKLIANSIRQNGDSLSVALFEPFHWKGPTAFMQPIMHRTHFWPKFPHLMCEVTSPSGVGLNGQQSANSRSVILPKGVPENRSRDTIESLALGIATWCGHGMAPFPEP
jgi:hypothetical protein